MKIYGVYDKEGQCRYVGTQGELMKEFNCSRSTITRAVQRGTRLKGEYNVIVVDEEGRR